MKVLATKNRLPIEWPNHPSNYQLPPEAYTKPWAKRSLTTRIELLELELAAHGITNAAAYSMFNHRTNIDAAPKSHLALIATHVMHDAGLLTGACLVRGTK